jgi:hypothetical protein
MEPGPHAVAFVPLAVPLVVREQSVPASAPGAMPIAISRPNASAARRKPGTLPEAAHPPPLQFFANSEAATTWRREVFHTRL